MKIVTGMDGNDNSTTRGRYMPLNYTLKNGSDGQFPFMCTSYGCPAYSQSLLRFSDAFFLSMPLPLVESPAAPAPERFQALPGGPCLVPWEPAGQAAAINFDSSLWAPLQTLGTSFKGLPPFTAISGPPSGETTPLASVEPRREQNCLDHKKWSTPNIPCFSP